ncbi:VOC family protein [Nocardioides sp. NPDC057767]|jgi:catechol 2,3-dioxygenase-like lactoylglutathione lyase family enzyme|uniref:VOC family protein n=1 Tax=unclassified Nocardioides TaxID=2615069 RepID=UPI003318BD56
MSDRSQPPPTTTGVHAVLHCNVNTRDAAGSAAFYERFGFTLRMRSTSDDTDGSALGIPGRTVSDTWFEYDARGPRAAPAVELVEWQEPATAPRPALSDGHAAGFAGLGIRVADVADLPAGVDADPIEVYVRGRSRKGVLTQGPDGVPVEIVEIDPGAEPREGRDGGRLSHARLVSTDLDRTIAWFAELGWRVVGDVRPDGVSLGVAEDPTFSLEFDLDADAVPHGMRANSEGLYRIALAVEDVSGAVERLRGLGWSVAEPEFIPMVDTPTGGFTVVVLTDPDGVVAELVTRPRSEVRRPADPA